MTRKWHSLWQFNRPPPARQLIHKSLPTVPPRNSGSSSFTADISWPRSNKNDIPMNTEIRTLDEGNPGAGDGGKTKGEVTWDGLKDASRS